jgi:hypothetical protein
MSVKRLHKGVNSHKMPLLSESARAFDPWKFMLEGFPSGQRDQTVNLTRKLRWFKSTPLHQLIVVRGVDFVGGYSSAVEPQPSKLDTRVRSPLPAPILAKKLEHLAR